MGPFGFLFINILFKILYETIEETGTFQPTKARALLKTIMGNNLSGKKWLDISAGWGDRLIAAMSLDMIYTGFDPNIELKSGHTEMINMFGNPILHKIIYEPFEKANIPDGPYDVILTSPPFFNVEEYVGGQEGQSIVSFPDFDTWAVWFLFASLSKAWDNLKEGGYLILHLGDTKILNITEVTNIFIENYLPGASWEGIIGISGESKSFRPTFNYKKISRNEIPKRWEPRGTSGIESSKRTLYNTFPNIFGELLRFYTNKYNSNYITKRSNIKNIRNNIKSKFSIIESKTIDELLSDDIMIMSFLEIMDTETTIKFLIDLIAKSPNKFEIYNELSTRAPYYSIRKSNANTIREYIAVRLSVSLSKADKLLINNILEDDLMITCLLEIFDTESTIKWGIAMVKLALNI